MNKDGKKVSALRFETDEKVYLIRMTMEQAIDIIEADSDYDDDDGSLMDQAKEGCEIECSDVDYSLSENENYEEEDER